MASLNLLNGDRRSQFLGRTGGAGSGSVSPDQYARNLGLLSHHSFKPETGTIEPNDAYVLPIGSELLTNGDFSAWTADDPDGWTEANESSPNREVTERDSGQLYAGTNVVGGSMNVFDDDSAGPVIGVSQSGLTPAGDTFRLLSDISAISGSVQVHEAGGVKATYNSTGLKSLDYIALFSSTIGYQMGGISGDATIDDSSLKKIGELDCKVSGTVEMGVAGLQGVRAGKLGSPVNSNFEFDSGLTDFSAQVTGDATIVASGGVATLTRPTSGVCNLRQLSLTAGDTYRATIVINAITGTWRAVNNTSSVVYQTFTAPGTYVFDFVSVDDRIGFKWLSGPTPSETILESFKVVPYTTPHAVYLDGTTSDLQIKRTSVDGLDNMTLMLQFYGFTLTSKVLAEKLDEWKLEIDASDHLVFTRYRALTDATATQIGTIAEDTWNEVIVTIEHDGADDDPTNINIWANGVLEATTDVLGDVASNPHVSNTNAPYIGMDAAVSAGMVGVLDEHGLHNAALSDLQIKKYFSALDGGVYT